MSDTGHKSDLQATLAIIEITKIVPECGRIRELSVALMKDMLDKGETGEAFKQVEQIFKHANESMHLANEALKGLTPLYGLDVGGNDAFSVNERGNA